MIQDIENKGATMGRDAGVVRKNLLADPATSEEVRRSLRFSFRRDVLAALRPSEGKSLGRTLRDLPGDIKRFVRGEVDGL